MCLGDYSALKSEGIEMRAGHAQQAGTCHLWSAQFSLAHDEDSTGDLIFLGAAAAAAVQVMDWVL